jgi:hypothetical protein
MSAADGLEKRTERDERMVITQSIESDARDSGKNSRERKPSVLFGSLPRSGDSRDCELTIDAINGVRRQERKKKGDTGQR